MIYFKARVSLPVMVQVAKLMEVILSKTANMLRQLSATLFDTYPKMSVIIIKDCIRQSIFYKVVHTKMFNITTLKLYHNLALAGDLEF